MQSSRIKISVSLSSDLVARIDRAAQAESRSRSRVLESWLRSGARQGAQHELELATIAYYEDLTPEERREDAAMAAGLSKSARRLDVDGARLHARRRGGSARAGSRRR
jgi:metal-responsive CopG/Arc/MetJ family transcriptional regulator